MLRRVWLVSSVLVCACAHDRDAATSAGGQHAAASGGRSAGGAGGADASVPTEHFSFFMTSYAAIQRLSGTPNGFGGDLRYGEADGLKGADKICAEIAETSLSGSSAKGWRAFLSVTQGPDGSPVHAIDRVGEGPWYDRLGRVLALTRADLLNTRPLGADPAIMNDFPNEDGVPNHAPDGTMQVDNHDVLTGTDTKGQLADPDWKFTCHDWTSTVGSDGTPRVGHSWVRAGGGFGMLGTGGNDAGFPRGPGGGRGFGAGGFGGPPGAGGAGGAGPGRIPGGPMGGLLPSAQGASSFDDWMASLTEAGCAPGASLVEMGAPIASNPTVGSGGGYGAFYCFALTP
jgi:hypothetical protein